MRNKLFSQYIILFMILIGMSSCEFLELDPQDQFERTDYYKNKNQAEMALAAIYAKVADLYEGNMSIWLNSGTDEFLYSQNNTSQRGGEISVYTYNAFTTDVKNIWNTHYDLISRANDFIYIVEGKDTISGLSMSERQAMLGEALTLRALSHFNLVRMFEYVPIRTKPFVDVANGGEGLYVEGAEPKEVYRQVIYDLQAAVGMLGEDPLATNRISKYAAHGLLARTFLHLAGARTNGGDYSLEECYNQVVSNCDAVINSGQHGLLSNYVDVFMNEIQQVQNDREVIWEANFVYTNERNLGGRIGNDNGPKVAATTSNADPVGNPWVYTTATLNALYGADYDQTPEDNPDVRHGWNIVNYDINYKNGGYVFPNNIGSSLRWRGGKWRRVQRVTNVDNNGNTSYSALYLETGAINKWKTSINFPLVRYSDVLLMKAEALNELYGPIIDAVDLVEEVRSRAGAIDVQSLLVQQGQGLSHESLFHILKDERSRELCYEGLRRFDLVRWGILLETVKTQNELIQNHPDYDADKDGLLILPGSGIQERHVVFPIPNDELTLNSKISQHPLWQ